MEETTSLYKEYSTWASLLDVEFGLENTVQASAGSIREQQFHKF